jgi:DNA polymerase III sliding clamp (beta) subunit (PCNA family)
MIVCNTQELKHRLNQIKHFYVRNKRFPILNCVRIDAKEITYSNFDMTVRIPLSSEGGGVFIIPFSQLYEFARGAKSSKINIDADIARRAIIDDGTNGFMINDVFSPDDFPVVPVYDFNVSGAAEADRLRRAFSCYYAADTFDIRFNLDGVCIDAANRAIVATDSHRLSLRSMNFTLQTDSLYVIPRFVANGLLKLLSNTTDAVQFSCSESRSDWLQIRYGDVDLYVTCRDRYPEYQRVIPRDGALKLTFTNPRQAVNQLEDIKKRSHKLRTLAIKGYNTGMVRVATPNYKGILEGCVAHVDCIFTVNIKYLIECLKQFLGSRTPVTVWNTKDKTSPWLFKTESSNDIDMIMPMRCDDAEAWFNNARRKKRKANESVDHASVEMAG